MTTTDLTPGIAAWLLREAQAGRLHPEVPVSTEVCLALASEAAEARLARVRRTAPGDEPGAVSIGSGPVSPGAPAGG